jgi:predicted 3-demethylubiquinone-9 3-methyltransferase (glyoxalase superfamily)
VPWQIVPSVMLKMLSDPDRTKAARAMQAMMQMVKLDIAELQRAYDGVPA